MDKRGSKAPAPVAAGKGGMFCVHEKCKFNTRILGRMEDMMNHTGAGHKVVDIVHL